MPRKKHPSTTAPSIPMTPSKRSTATARSPSPASTVSGRISNPSSPYKTDRKSNNLPHTSATLVRDVGPISNHSMRYSPTISEMSTSASEDEGGQPLSTSGPTRMRSTSPNTTAVVNAGEEVENPDTSKQVKTQAQAICHWNDCGETFNNLQPFIDHLHQTHIGIHKSKYMCEWSGCIRKGKPQTSRFALLSHLRSHTGEKPFTCPRPECDKSFTRSDALSKHMRVQHNIVTPGSRKAVQVAATVVTTTAAAAAAAASVLVQVDDDDSMLGPEAGGRAADSLGDELLELAEGEEDSFGFGTKAGKADVNFDTMSAEELGIQERITAYSDEDEAKLADSILFKARRSWVREIRERERERRMREAHREKELLRHHLANGGAVDESTQGTTKPGNGALPTTTATSATTTTTATKRTARTDDYDSDSHNEDEDEQEKRIKMENDVGSFATSAPLSSTSATSTGTATNRGGGSSTKEKEKEKEEQAIKTTRQRYLVEKAKLRYARSQNDKMWHQFRQLQEEQRYLHRDCRKALENALVYELGPDVDAIFSPVASPSLDPTSTTNQDGYPLPIPPPHHLDDRQPGQIVS